MDAILYFLKSLTTIPEINKNMQHVYQIDQSKYCIRYRIVKNAALLETILLVSPCKIDFTIYVVLITFMWHFIYDSRGLKPRRVSYT